MDCTDCCVVGEWTDWGHCVSRVQVRVRLLMASAPIVVAATGNESGNSDDGESKKTTTSAEKLNLYCAAHKRRESRRCTVGAGALPRFRVVHVGITNEAGTTETGKGAGEGMVTETEKKDPHTVVATTATRVTRVSKAIPSPITVDAVARGGAAVLAVQRVSLGIHDDDDYDDTPTNDDDFRYRSLSTGVWDSPGSPRSPPSVHSPLRTASRAFEPPTVCGIATVKVEMSLKQVERGNGGGPGEQRGHTLTAERSSSSRGGRGGSEGSSGSGGGRGDGDEGGGGNGEEEAQLRAVLEHAMGGGSEQSRAFKVTSFASSSPCLVSTAAHGTRTSGPR